MQVTVLLFASYADAFGADRVAVALPDGASVAQLVAALRGTPGGARIPSRPLVAVNRRYAPADRTLDSTDEVALIPPVAGG